MPVQVPDLHQAYIFYCDGLSFTQDPGTWSKQRGGFKVLWFNLGRHQVSLRSKTGLDSADAARLHPAAIIDLHILACLQRLASKQRFLISTTSSHQRLAWPGAMSILHLSRRLLIS